jgi:hypothetical protein
LHNDAALVCQQAVVVEAALTRSQCAVPRHHG